MGEYPETTQQFQDWFSTEDSCRDYLFRLRWPEGFRCPRCKNERAWVMGRRLFRCTECDLETSITAGTIFQDSRKSLRLNDASAENLEAAIKDIVAPGSLIRTDEWRGYNGLKAQGYFHKVVRTNSSVGENLLPLANRVTSLLKRWLLGTHQGAVRPSHLDYYLDEFTLRFNRRTSKSRGKLFFRLVQQAMAIDPVPAKSIVGGHPEA